MAIAHDAHGHRPELAAAVGFAFPAAGADRGIGGAKLVEQREHHADDVLANRSGIAFGGIVDGDGAFGGGCEIDVFEARAAAAHKSEGWHGVHEFGVHHEAGADDDACNIVQNLAEDSRTGDVECVEDFKSCGGQALGNDRMNGFKNRNAACMSFHHPKIKLEIAEPTEK